MAPLHGGWTTIMAFLMLGFANAQFGKGPPRYNMENLPQTRFTCEGKLAGRYYADQETDCQMFHVCTKMSSRDVSDYRFLCPNGTVFDQEHQVCADYYQVVCLASGTNPLGQIFELYKLNSKESTNRQEFGEAPIQDPDYIGQNSLGGGEDFQAEEYNNNKLAASQNSIPYQTYEKTNPQNIFFQSVATSTTTQRPVPTTARTTTERYVAPTAAAPAPTVRSRTRTTTTDEPVFRSPIPTTEEPQVDFSDLRSVNKFSQQFHKSNYKVTLRPDATAEPELEQQNYYTSTFAPYVEYSTEPQQRYYETEATSTPGTTQRTTTYSAPRAGPRRPVAQAQDPEDPDFSDFSALSKFQNDFHHSSFNQRPTTTLTPEAEYFKETAKPTEFVKSKAIKTVPTYSTIPTAGFPVQQEEYELKEFANLARFQQEHQGFTQSPARGEFAEFVTTLEPRTTAAPVTRRTTEPPPPPNIDTIDFSDFSALSKFQNSFHKSFKENASPTTTTTTTTKSEKQLNNFVQVFLTKPTPKPVAPVFQHFTTEAATTARKIPTDSSELSYDDFTALSKFNDYQKSDFVNTKPTAAQEFVPKAKTTGKTIKVAGIVQPYPSTEKIVPTTVQTTIPASPIVKTVPILPASTSAPKTSSSTNKPRPTTPRPPPPSLDTLDFSDFASLSKFQNQFHKSITQKPTYSPGEEIPNNEYSDFNTKPRTETQVPLFSFQKNTSPAPIYHSTYRSTFSDIITTPSPQTFQQQAVKFDDDFFIRQPSQRFQDTEEQKKPIKFSSPIYTEPEKQKGSVTKKSQATTYDEFEVELFPAKTRHIEPTTKSTPAPTPYAEEIQETIAPSSARPSRRGGRKRVKPSVATEEKYQESEGAYDPQYKYSRRVQNARFEDRESYAVRERSQSKNDEIFSAEASVFRGPANANAYYEGFRRQQVTQAPTEVTRPAPVEESKPATTTTGHVFGRRVRPFRRDREQQQEQAQGRRVGGDQPIKEAALPDPDSTPTDSGEVKKSGKTRVVKRLRQKGVGGGADLSQTSSELPPSSSTNRTQPSRVRTKTITVSRRLSGVGGDVTRGPVPHRDRPASLISTTTTERTTTTTPEPELVTASDEEVARLRAEDSNKKGSEVTSEKSKSAKKAGKSEKSDYDYTYYDTERDSDYSDITGTNFGIRPGKSLEKY